MNQTEEERLASMKAQVYKDPRPKEHFDGFHARVRSRKPAVLCSHGPVLPAILSELALATGTVHGSYIDSASDLGMAAFSVVHLSATNPGSGIISIETHETKV